MSTSTPPHILVIEARFYEDIADHLVEGAVAELQAAGASFERIAVPGALEIPQVLGLASEAMRFAIYDEPELAQAGAAKPFDGAIILGCVIRGETSHYDVVVNNANHWTMELAMLENLPLGNGLLTVDSREQALKRAQGGSKGKGGDAARACLRLVDLRRQFQAALIAAETAAERPS